MAGAYAHLTPEDVAAAQAVLDAWEGYRDVAVKSADDTNTFQAALIELRGIIAVQLCDVRDAGYIAGRLQGRREVAAWVRDALAGEGL